MLKDLFDLRWSGHGVVRANGHLEDRVWYGLQVPHCLCSFAGCWSMVLSGSWLNYCGSAKVVWVVVTPICSIFLCLFNNAVLLIVSENNESLLPNQLSQK